MKMKEKVMNDFIAEIAELKQQRDGWREDATISKVSIDMLKGRCDHLERENAKQGEMLNKVIEQQAERIKELEETLETSRAAAESYELRLAALRQRIADAPVVMQKCVLVDGNTWHFRVVSLISKEDLK